MTPIDRFERQLPAALSDLAGPRTPDYFIDILGQTARTRQRPAWASIERWLPMDITSPAAPGTRLPWRPLVLVALLGLLLGTVVVAYIGSQSRRMPAAPFGPAANGSIVFARDGDIYTADPVTGASKAIVTGTELDSDPVYSPDGTRIAFGRAPDSDPAKRLLFVADDTGRGPIQVTPAPVRDLTMWSFSPDGHSIVALGSGEEGWSILIMPADGSGPGTAYPVFATRDDTPPAYRADGAEIMFIGRKPGAPGRGVYGLDPATGAVRTIVAPLAAPRDIHGATWSPDGRHLAYGEYDPTAATASARTHVVAPDGTGDVTVDTDPRSAADFGAAWSNDGTRMIVTRFYSDTKLRSVIVPVDRSGPGVEIGCPPTATTDDCSVDWSWSPDDSVLLGVMDGSGGLVHLLADPATGAVRGAPWAATSRPAWQRLAP